MKKEEIIKKIEELKNEDLELLGGGDKEKGEKLFDEFMKSPDTPDEFFAGAVCAYNVVLNMIKRHI